MIRNSLYRKLFLSFTLVLLVMVFISSVIIFKVVSHEIDENYDVQLISDSYLIWTLASEDIRENDGDLDKFNLDFSDIPLNGYQRDSLEKYKKWWAFRVWKGDKLIAQSNPEAFKQLPKFTTGFSNQLSNNDKWRAYSLYIAKSGVWVETMLNTKKQEHVLGEVEEALIVPAAIIIPLLAIVLFFLVRYGISSIYAMKQVISSRNPDDLSDLEIKGLPSELAPLLKSLNQLLAKLRESRLKERQFIDIASHELRTPLSALKLQGQIILNAPKEERAEAINDLLKGIDRTTHLFNQILLLSRIQHQKIHLKNVSLAELVGETMENYALVAAQKNIEVELEDTASAKIKTNPELLKIMLGMLIDNAIKYTPENGAINIELGKDSIDITDSGEGIPQNERKKVFDHFYRVEGTTQSGSGLGLAIVKRICETLGISIKLSDAKKHSGLHVHLAFTDQD